MTGIRAKLAVVATLAGLGFALIGLPGAVSSLQEVRGYELDDRWAGGVQWGVDIDFLDWVAGQIDENDRFLVVNGDGNLAIDLWSTYQLYPATRTTDPDQADWAIVYGTSVEESGLDPEAFGEIRTYSDSLHLLKKTGGTPAESSSDGS